MTGESKKLGRKIKILRIFSDTEKEELIDIIPSELFLRIILNDNPVASLSCSPGELVELSVGFLVNNDYIKEYPDIDLLRIFKNDTGRKMQKDEFFVNIVVNADNISHNIDDIDLKRINHYKSENLDDLIIKTGLKKIKSSLQVEAKTILKLNSKTKESQKLKKEFGGLHSAALFDINGRLLRITEDIGRHNCIDKLAGFVQIKKLGILDKILYTTGRVSTDVIYKVSRMSVPVLVTNSSITYSAVMLAEKTGITVIGYAREGRFNIYSNPRRIII